MEIKLIQQWGMSPAGTILESVAKPVADLLIKRKIAEVIKAKKRSTKNDNR